MRNKKFTIGLAVFAGCALMLLGITPTKYAASAGNVEGLADELSKAIAQSSLTPCAALDVMINRANEFLAVVPPGSVYDGVIDATAKDLKDELKDAREDAKDNKGVCDDGSSGSGGSGDVGVGEAPPPPDDGDEPDA